MGHSSESGDTSSDGGVFKVNPTLSPVTSKRRFFCTFPNCTASFNRQWKLDGHICRHTNERPFTCGIVGCDKAYTTKSHLLRHSKISHNSNEQELFVYVACPHLGCGKHFRSKSSLQKHQKKHVAPPKYKCEECNITFNKHHQLSSHNHIHTGQYPFLCQICQSGYFRKGDLERHNRKHQISYTCEYSTCDAVLENWTLLRKHMKVFHPPVYSCAQCLKTFKNKHWLEEHLLSHLSSEEREVFSCSYLHCTKFYYHKRNLRQHVKSFHENHRFVCTVADCNSTLSTKAKLLSHVKRLHGPSCMPKLKKVKVKREKHEVDRQNSVMSSLTGIPLPKRLDDMLVVGEDPSLVQQEVNKLIDKYMKFAGGESETESKDSTTVVPDTTAVEEQTLTVV